MYIAFDVFLQLVIWFYFIKKNQWDLHLFMTVVHSLSTEYYEEFPSIARLMFFINY